MLLDGVVPALCSKRCPKARSSASCAVVYALSDMEESVTAIRSTHIPSAADAQSPPRLLVGRGYRVVRDAWLSARVAASAATPPLPDRSRHPHRPRQPPLALPPHLPLARCQARYDLLGADSDRSAPRPDASAAKSTSARLPLHCARRARPTARTAAVSRRNLAGLEPSAGFEARQAAWFVLILPPLFWRHLGTSFFAYHTQKGACPHRQGHVAIPAPKRAHLIVIQAHLAFGRLNTFFDRPA